MIVNYDRKRFIVQATGLVFTQILKMSILYRVPYYRGIRPV
jgi:hypothetical protein